MERMNLQIILDFMVPVSTFDCQELPRIASNVNEPGNTGVFNSFQSLIKILN